MLPETAEALLEWLEERLVSFVPYTHRIRFRPWTGPCETLCSFSMSPRRNIYEEAQKGVLGLGLDGKDGHKRVTQGDDFLLLGGSRETHERMQDVVLRMRDRLERRGKTFRDLSSEEFEDLARDSL